jgi:GNAT superfamily N-acetyltransferase/predicted nucleic acid-binding protein
MGTRPSYLLLWCNLNMSQSNVRVLSKPEEVAAYVDQARLASDEDKESLGFLPERAYKEAAYQGKLLIAIVQESNDLVYAGHLLHGGVFPHARIFQVFTVARFRRRGIGRRLVEAIVRTAESLQFMSVVAKVADDLAANEFWERLLFEVVRTKAGGRTTGRQINVRVRELDGPRLFSLVTPAAQPSTLDLKLISRLSDVSPTYVLDLNILYDLLKKRANVEDVGRIVRASFNNLVRLAVTEEFIKELERTSIPDPTDPILEMARRLPRLKAPPLQILDQIVMELRTVLFPNETLTRTLRSQDQSDLVHLATAIHHKASGFVTGEKAILRSREALQSRYSLDVLGANEFANIVEPTESEIAEVQAFTAGQVLQGRPAHENDITLVEAFLGRMNCPQQLKEEAIANDSGRPRRRVLITLDGAVVAFGSWEIPSATRPHVRALVCVDEDRATVTLAAEYLLDLISRESFSDYPTQSSLRLLPGHTATKRIAIAHGFRPSADESSVSNTLQKIALGRIVTSKNWGWVRQQLKKGMTLELPESIPLFHSPEQTISIKGPTGQEVNIPLRELETLLSPTLFCLPGRPAAIVPIRRVYAADLIGGAKQRSMLASPEAVLLRERVYFSNPRTAGIFTKGIPILFYESARNGGSASVMATARVVRAELVPSDGANHELFQRGVLDKKILTKICSANMTVATTIDNIMLLQNPVRLARLRELGAIDGANLVTARLLLGEQVIQIIEEGIA